MANEEIKFERKGTFKEFKNAYYDALNKKFFDQEDIDGILLEIYQYGERQFEAGQEQERDGITDTMKDLG